MTPGRPLVVGIAGGTGSGKTTVARSIAAASGEQHVALLPQDAYYRAQHDVPLEVRRRTNYDEPSAFDTELLIRHVDDLVTGRPIDRPVYDFAIHDRSTETIRLTPTPVLLVEGILVLHDAALRDRFTLKVFVDAPPDERFIRRLERDVKDRGRSAENVIEQYRNSVKPMHDLFVEPTKQHADLILPGGGRNRVALDVLTRYVTSRLRDVQAAEGTA